MTPRLDHRPSRSLWIALVLAAVLFLLAIVLSFTRMSATDPVLQQKDLATGRSAVVAPR
jgi:flagellar basal body-associated protein FliL